MRRNRLRASFVLSICVLCGGCGSGGTTPAPAAEPLTAQQIITACVAPDLGSLAGLLEILQGMLDPAAGLPQPQLDLLRFLVDGTFGWSLDVDEDGTVDIDGTIGFTDAAGQPTLPFDIGDLIAGGTPDPATLFADLPAGTTVHLTFDTAGLGDLALAATTTGRLSITPGDGQTVSGDGTFQTDACAFDFAFDDIDPTAATADGFPVATVTFSLDSGGQALGGSIDLDGTSDAVVHTDAATGSSETFVVDLATGTVTGG